MLRHFVCVLALMWTGVVNGQPFFFPDTTNYIRAADAAMFFGSGKRISTAWTDRYRPVAAAGKSAAPAIPSAVNDVGNGTVMAGRSPYLGAMIWLGYVIADFWPFVLFQASVCYALILLALRRFGIVRPATTVSVVFALAATTSVPTYDSLLLADAFAAFGMLAFLLLAVPGRLTRLETGFLVAVLMVSAVVHLTHILLLIAMLATLVVIHLARRSLVVPRRAWIGGVAAVLVGLLSVQATAWATQAAFGRKPQLLPLLTARFYVDGPGRRFIAAGCDDARFTVCHVPIGFAASVPAFLFATDPGHGAFMLGDADQRRRMGAEDVGFALAVLRYDPAGQGRMLIVNTVRQLAWIDYDGLNVGCFAEPDCWTALPAPVRDTLRRSPSGRNAWPDRTMNAILYLAVFAALAALAIGLRPLARRDPDRARVARLWLLVGGVGFLANAFLGGAVSDPQYRYEGRMVWLVVLLAMLVVLAWRNAAPRTDSRHLA